MRKKVIWHLQDENFNDVDTFKAKTAHTQRARKSNMGNGEYRC